MLRAFVFGLFLLSQREIPPHFLPAAKRQCGYRFEYSHSIGRKRGLRGDMLGLKHSIALLLGLVLPCFTRCCCSPIATAAVSSCPDLVEYYYRISMCTVAVATPAATLAAQWDVIPFVHSPTSLKPSGHRRERSLRTGVCGRFLRTDDVAATGRVRIQNKKASFLPRRFSGTLSDVGSLSLAEISSRNKAPHPWSRPFFL